MNEQQRLALELIDRAAADIQQLHTGAQLAFVGMLGMALDAPDATSSVERTRLAKLVNARASTYAQQIERQVERVAIDMLGMGHIHAGSTLTKERMDELKSLAAPAVSSTFDRVSQGLSIDAETVSKQFRQFQFEAAMFISAGSTRSSAMIRAKQGKVLGLKFERVDSAGRLWSSIRQSHLSARGLFLSAYVEAFVFTLAASGEDTAYVDYADPEHVNHGLAFSITGSDTTKPAYLDIRDGIWHPNSQVLVSHVSP